MGACGVALCDIEQHRQIGDKDDIVVALDEIIGLLEERGVMDVITLPLVWLARGFVGRRRIDNLDAA